MLKGIWIISLEVIPLNLEPFIFDCEVFAYDWLFVFKNKVTKEYTVIWNDNEAVEQFMTQEPLLAGFNNKHYDQFILKAVLSGFTPEEIKAEYRAVVAALDALMATSPCFTLKSLAVSGRDLMAAGLPKGHIVGQALAYLLDEVMAERLPNARDALLDAAIRQFGGMS